MKNLNFVVISTILISFSAVSQSGVISEFSKPLDQVESYSIVDSIIKAILEQMRPKLADLKFDDINKSVENSSLNVTVIIKDILIKNADKFVIQSLKSNIIPLKLTNLTLIWSNITASASYDLSASIDIPKVNGPFRVFGKGQAKGILNDLFFTTGANLEMKNNAIQIKPKGLFGFDMSIRSSNVTFSNLMESSELGNAVGVFISKVIPDLVDTLKNPVFNSFQDDIIRIVNKFLKKNGTSLFMDEESQPLLDSRETFEGLDLSEEISAFFRQRFDLGMEKAEFDSESEF